VGTLINTSGGIQKSVWYMAIPHETFCLHVSTAADEEMEQQVSTQY